MKQYSEAAVERMMKVREVILRALAKRITWWQAADLQAGHPFRPDATSLGDGARGLEAATDPVGEGVGHAAPRRGRYLPTY